MDADELPSADDVVETDRAGDDEQRADGGIECVTDRRAGDRFASQVGSQLVGRSGEPAAAAGREQHHQRVRRSGLRW